MKWLVAISSACQLFLIEVTFSEDSILLQTSTPPAERIRASDIVARVDASGEVTFPYLKIRGGHGELFLQEIALEGATLAETPATATTDILSGGQKVAEGFELSSELSGFPEGVLSYRFFVQPVFRWKEGTSESDPSVLVMSFPGLSFPQSVKELVREKRHLQARTIHEKGGGASIRLGWFGDEGRRIAAFLGNEDEELASWISLELEHVTSGMETQHSLSQAESKVREITAAMMALYNPSTPEVGQSERSAYRSAMFDLLILALAYILNSDPNRPDSLKGVLKHVLIPEHFQRRGHDRDVSRKVSELLNLSVVRDLLFRGGLGGLVDQCEMVMRRKMPDIFDQIEGS